MQPHNARYYGNGVAHLVVGIAWLALAGAASGSDAVNCGKPAIEPQLEATDRILGGSEAVPGSWPWQAGVHSAGHVCGGALISDRYVLTAAHCTWTLPTSGVKVHLGSHSRNPKDDGEVWVEAEEVCTHPNYRVYNKMHWINDLAIIKLKQAVDFSTTVRPVCLPSNYEELPEGSELYVAGWGVTGGGNEGKSPRLKQLKTVSYSNERCIDEFAMSVPHTIICGSHAHGSSCYGDSGGPVVHKADDRWVLHGVVSGGPTACGSDDEPLYFTKVSEYTKNLIGPYLNGSTPRWRIRQICDIA